MSGISYTMATEIAINTVSAQQSIKGLNSALSSAVNSMKAGIAQASSVGDSLGAMQAKVSGLDQVMTQLQSKIDVLKDKQSDLDVKTKEGAESYLKLQKQIEQSENRLASYSAQQDRAKESMTYYSSGLAELQRGYQTTIEKTDAYSNRLKAEGDELGANKAKLSGYKEALTNLNSQYEKQNDELKNNQAKVKELSTSYNEAKSKLDELKTAGKTSSDAYKEQAQQVNELRLALGRANESLDTQKIRIDKTGTSIAETKTKTAELSSQIDKEAPQGFFKSLQNGFRKTSDESDRTKSKVGGALSYFAGGTLLNGVTMLTSGLQNQAKAGYEDAKAADSFGKAWSNMGVNKRGIDELGSSLKDLKENTSMSGAAIIAMEKQFYGLNGSVKQTAQLAKGVGSLSDQLHLNQTQSDAFAKGLNRIESSGKVTSLSLGRLEKQAPGLGTALQKSSGMSKDAFDKLVQSGKMTSNQFNQILNTASKNYEKNKNSFNASADGSLHHLQTSFDDTRKSLMKPLVSVSNTGFNALSKALDNPVTQKAVEQLGKGIANLSTQAAGLINHVSAHSKDITVIIGSLAQIIKLLASGVWSLFKGVVDSIAGAFNLLSGNAKKASNPIHLVADGLKGLSRWQVPLRLLGGTLATVFAVNKIIAFTNAIKANKAVMLGWSAITAVLSDVKNGLVLTRLQVIALTVQEKAAAVASKVMAAAQGVLKAAVIGVKNGLVLTRLQVIALTVQEKAAAVASKVMAGAQWLLNAALSANPFGLIIVATAALIAGFVLAYKRIKPFRDAMNELGTMIASVFKGIASYIGGFWNGIKGIFNSSLKFISSVWNGTWNGIFSFGKGIWNGIASVFNGFVGGIKNIWNDVTGFVGRMWSGMWNKVIGSAKSAIHTVRRVVAQIANGVIRPIDSMLGKLKDGINWILDKVGAHKIGGFHIPLVSYANGTKDTHQGGLAMVNDAPGSNFREMYQLPNGQIGMFPNKRNMIIPLPKGASVLDGERSASMAKMMGLPVYKNGIGDFFGGLWNGAKDIFSDVENILKNPAKFMESTFSHFLGGFSSNIKLASSIITSFPKKLASESINWVKKQFESMEAPAGSGAARWHDVIKRALAMDGASTSEAMIQKWIRQVNTESGGNEKAIGGNDGLADGNAMGLVQVKPGTFNANKFPGHNNPLNGFDSLLAGIKYAMKRYGASMGFIGHGHGYENGGFINRHQMIEVGEHNMNEVVIPLDSSKRSRTTELMHQVLDMLAGNSDVNLDTKVNSKQDDKVAALINEVSELKDTVKDLVNLQIETIKAQNGTTNAVISTAQTPQDRYKQDAQNGQLLGYQQLNGGFA